MITNLNSFFYYDDSNICGFIKIKELSVRRTNKIPGYYLLEILKHTDLCVLKCSGDYLFTIIDDSKSEALLTIKSYNGIIKLQKNEILELIANNNNYYFEIFAKYNEIQILIDNHRFTEYCKDLITLFHFAVPTRNFSLFVSDLFFKGKGHFFKEENINVLYLNNDNNIADFNTYMNSFSIKKWKNLTGITDYYLNFKIKGDVIIRLKNNEPSDNFCFSVTRVKSIRDFRNVCIKLDSSEINDIVGVQFDAVGPTEISDIKWMGVPQRQIANCKLAICVTVFNEPDSLLNLEKLAQELSNIIDKNDFHIYIVDNSKTLYQNRITQQVSIIKNENYGGTGGFSRGLIEAIRDKYDLCLFMDDDAFTSPYSIEKAFNIIKYSIIDNLSISGAMLDKNNMFNQLESGAYFYSGCHPLHCNLDARDPKTFVDNDRELIPKGRKIYGSWWFFMFKISENIKMPFPFFVRGDDIDFSYKNNFTIYTLTGVCSWQENFIKKETPISVFLFIRSHILHHLTLNIDKTESEIISSILSVIKTHIIRYLRQYRYDLALSVILAANFVLAGSKHWQENLLLANYLKEVKELCTKYEGEVIEKSKIKRTFNFYKSLRIWPITHLVKKYSIYGILLPSFIMSHKNWELSSDNFVDPKFIFLKDRYILDLHNGSYKMYRHSLKTTISFLLMYKMLCHKLSRSYTKLVDDYKQLYDEFCDKNTWKKLMENNEND